MFGVVQHALAVHSHYVYSLVPSVLHIAMVIVVRLSCLVHKKILQNKIDPLHNYLYKVPNALYVLLRGYSFVIIQHRIYCFICSLHLPVTLRLM